MILLDIISRLPTDIALDYMNIADFGISALIASMVIAAASATAQGVSQKKANEKQKDYEADKQRKIDAKAAQENAFYRMEYYRDPMRTAEGANALKQIREYNQRLTDIQRNRGVITGATHEQTIAQQGKAMQAYSNAVSNIRADNERTRRYIGQNWLAAQNNQFTRQMTADDAQHAVAMQGMQNVQNNIQNFAQGAQQVASGMIASQIPPQTYNPNVNNTGGNFAESANIANATPLYDTSKGKRVKDPNTGLYYTSYVQ